MARGVKIIKKPSRGTALNTVFTTTTLLVRKETTLKQKQKRGNWWETTLFTLC